MKHGAADVGVVSDALQVDWHFVGPQPAMITDAFQVRAIVVMPVDNIQFPIQQGRN